MRAMLADGVGNAASAHAFGRRLSAVVEVARNRVAELVGAQASGVVFTAGATEANNLSLRGAVECHLRNTGAELAVMYRQEANSSTKPERRTRSGKTRLKHPHLLISAVEHSSVKQTAVALATQRLADVNVIPVHPNGELNLDALDEMLTEQGKDILLISVMAANSETGVINPLAAIAKRAHEAGALFHCDATQHAGRLPFEMSRTGADLLSLSSHKISGPGGVGALVGTHAALNRLSAVIHGGGQERGLRSGSLNVAGIAGFGEAAKLASAEREAESLRVGTLRDLLVRELEERLDGVSQNGDVKNRLPNTANLRFARADAEAVLANMHPVAASVGSACSAGAVEPSAVLLAMGLSPQAAYESVRFSLGRFSTEAEVRSAAVRVAEAVRLVRKMAA